MANPEKGSSSGPACSGVAARFLTHFPIFFPSTWVHSPLAFFRYLFPFTPITSPPLTYQIFLSNLKLFRGVSSPKTVSTVSTSFSSAASPLLWGVPNWELEGSLLFPPGKRPTLRNCKSARVRDSSLRSLLSSLRMASRETVINNLTTPSFWILSRDGRISVSWLC